MRQVIIDFETKSYAQLDQVGARIYAEHPTTEIICLGYKINRDAVQTWWPGKQLTGDQAWPSLYGSPLAMPFDLYDCVMRGYKVKAFNAFFEKMIWRFICSGKLQWANPLTRQWRDIMAVAAYYAMPLKLDRLLRALGIGTKNPEGTRLISKYCKLCLKTAKVVIPQGDFDKFLEYVTDDCEQEFQVDQYLGDLPAEELEVFFLDQEINEYGIPLDLTSIHNATAIVEQRATELTKKFQALTGINPTQRDQVLKWLHARGCHMDNLQADYIEDRLKEKGDDEIQGKARKALEIRSQVSKASTKKLDAMERNRASTGRAHGQCQYHGTGTGRPGGRGFQPLNLNKGYEGVDPEQLITDISYRDPKWLDTMYDDDAIEVVGKASRHHIKAEDGHRIMAGDYVSIEAVLLACLAGEEWKIEAFRNGDPVYELMACKIHNMPEEARQLALQDKNAFKKKYPAERFDGKTGELQGGYQGWVGAWRQIDNSDRYTDEQVADIMRGWRRENPAIVDYWGVMEDAAIDAVAYPGEVTEARLIRFKMYDDWLGMRLPNGKKIWYFDPQLRMGMPIWHNPQEDEKCADGTCSCEPKVQLTYMAQKEGQWKRTYTYGGKLTENATQATSRELLVPATLALRRAGYNIIFTVYDEIVCHMPFGKGSLEEMDWIMRDTRGYWGRDLPPNSDYDESWCDDWPINVDCWEGPRYKK